MFGASGCQDGPVVAVGNIRSRCFESACVRVAGLTRIVEKQAQEQDAYIRAVVEVQDKYESRMKAPGRFRFELYEYQARSGQIKGERIVIWPDFDLGNQERNNQYWRDFLRAYEFSLPLLKVPSSRPVVLEVTFLSGQHRMSDTYLVK
jgi:hypothetical protein